MWPLQVPQHSKAALEAPACRAYQVQQCALYLRNGKATQESTKHGVAFEPGSAEKCLNEEVLEPGRHMKISADSPIWKNQLDSHET